MRIKIFHRDRAEPSLPMISADARLLAWPGTGAHMANMNFVVLKPGEANARHEHLESEDSIYIVEGRGSVLDFRNGRRLEFEAGDAIHVPVGLPHAVQADLGVKVVSVGGPCPPDLALLRAIRLVDADGGEGGQA